MTHRAHPTMLGVRIDDDGLAYWPNEYASDPRYRPVPDPHDLRTAATALVHALRYYGFHCSYNGDLVKAKLEILERALTAHDRS